MNQLVIDLPPEVTAEEARLLLAIRLFEIGRLSMGQAARLAGCSRSTFIGMAP
jgi:predicted HTH domain antitoxin